MDAVVLDITLDNLDRVDPYGLKNLKHEGRQEKKEWLEQHPDEVGYGRLSRQGTTHRRWQ